MPEAGVQRGLDDEGASLDPSLNPNSSTSAGRGRGSPGGTYAEAHTVPEPEGERLCPPRMSTLRASHIKVLSGVWLLFRL